MARKGNTPKRAVVVDPVYKSKLVAYMIKKILLKGKKSTAEYIVYGSLKLLEEKTKENPFGLPDMKILTTKSQSTRRTLRILLREYLSALRAFMVKPISSEATPQRRHRYRNPEERPCWFLPDGNLDFWPPSGKPDLRSLQFLMSRCCKQYGPCLSKVLNTRSESCPATL